MELAYLFQVCFSVNSTWKPKKFEDDRMTFWFVMILETRRGW